MARGWLALAGFVAAVIVGLKAWSVANAVAAEVTKEGPFEAEAPLAARAAEFHDAWETGDPESLTPLFRPRRSDEMVELVRKLADRHWEGALPPLGPPNLPARAGRDVPGSKVDVLHGIPGGSLKVRWILDGDLERWVVLGFGLD